MKRRQFITLFGGAAAAWPFAARAQQPKTPVIGFLNTGTADAYADMVAAFRQGLGEAGFSEGRNLAIEYRWAGGQYDRLPALATDLVRRQVEVLTTSGGYASAVAAKSATSNIPIVFNVGNNPVRSGLVASLNHPGGNVTGVYSQAVELTAKNLGLLQELVPTAKTIAVLVNPDGMQVEERDAREAAAASGLQIRILKARTESEIEAAFETLIDQPADIMLVVLNPLFFSHAAQITMLAARQRVPTMYGRRPFAEAGGLISYGDDVAYSYRQAGLYTGRVLKGEKSADLPIVQTNKFELVINLKTAKALGLTVPPTLLAIADEVIE